MVLMSPAGTAGSPGISREPSTRTRLRWEPRSRRLILSVPVGPFDILAFCDGKTDGRSLMTLVTSVAPAYVNSGRPTTVTGLGLVRFVWGIREPVTMMVSA